MTPPPIKAPFELPQTEMTEAEIIAMAKAHGVDCTMLSSIFEYTRAVERRATLSHPAAQAGAVQAVDAAQIEAAAKIMAECWQCPWDRIHERGRDHMRNYAKAVADVLAATQPSAAPAKAAAASSPDPLGCNACTHPDCGRFNGPRSVECRAMADNACARKDAAPGDGQTRPESGEIPSAKAEDTTLTDAERSMLTFLFSQMEHLTDTEWRQHSFRRATFERLQRKLAGYRAAQGTRNE